MGKCGAQSNSISPIFADVFTCVSIFLFSRRFCGKLGAKIRSRQASPAEEAPCFSSYSQPEIKKIEVAVNYMYRKLYGKCKGAFSTETS